MDGQAVNQSVTNAAFINKNIDDTMSNKLTFNRAGSGASISDIQAAVNKLYTCTGSSESVTGTVYSATPSTISDGDDHRTALYKLAEKFHPATGHTHTGAAGDAPPVLASSVASVPLLGYIEGPITVTGATGGSVDVSSLFSGKTSSSGSTVAGVPTLSPQNKVLLLYGGSNAQYGSEICDSLGNLVYGRLTFSAGTWTLAFYSVVSGGETTYFFGSAIDLLLYYQEIFNPLDIPPNYNEQLLDRASSYLWAIPVLTATLAGKAFAASAAPPDIMSSGSAGTANGSVANADHTHRGVHSVAVSGNSSLYGDVILTAGSGVSVGQSGNTISITGSGGGGGGSLSWVEGENSPTPIVEFGNEVYSFDSGLGQDLTTVVKVPNSYGGGSPIKMRMTVYDPDSSGNLLFQTVSTLIRTGTDAISSTTNQRTSTNSAITLGAGTVNIPQAVTFDLSDSTGKINGVSVSAGDLILVTLSRGTDTGTSAAKALVYGSELSFT